jgi:Clp amino terminal domain, pathogenicity island component
MMEYLSERGFNVDSMVWGSPVINIAVGNAMIPQVECLVRCGANLDLKGSRPNQSAREIARDMFESFSDDADRRRVVEVCGLDPDAIVAERDARVLPPPKIAPKLQQTLELAADDALRLGQSDVRPENLLFGLLRSGGLPVLFFTKASRIDLDRFREDVKERVRVVDDRIAGSTPLMHPDAQAMIDAAFAAASERRGDLVNQLHLLYALLQDADGAAATLLERYGSSAAAVNTELLRSF